MIAERAAGAKDQDQDQGEGSASASATTESVERMMREMKVSGSAQSRQERVPDEEDEEEEDSDDGEVIDRSESIKRSGNVTLLANRRDLAGPCLPPSRIVSQADFVTI